MLNVTYASDERYLMPTAVSIASLMHFASRKEEVVVHILCENVSDCAWNNFKSMVAKCGARLNRIAVDLSRYGAFRSWRGSYSAYARLDIPQILEDADWCVYVDGDTLFTDDIFKIEKYNISRYAVIGHEDRMHNGKFYNKTWYVNHGLTLDPEQYINAGFLVMNLTWMRETDFTNKAYDFLKLHGAPKFPDQDTINVICHGKILQLKGPSEWGAESESISNQNFNPGCIHYVGRLPYSLGQFGIFDVGRLWFIYARKFLGVQPRELYLLRDYLRYLFKTIVGYVYIRLCFWDSARWTQKFSRRTWRMLLARAEEAQHV